MNILHIRLLGDFSVKVGREPVAALNKPRLQSLLTYLILHREVPQFRYHLASLLWPDSPETQAYTNLRHLVYLLRQALPEGDTFILSDNQTLQWNNDLSFTLDVLDFQRLLSGDTLQNLPLQNLEEALRLYQGDLLPSCYDEWVSTEREHLRQTFISLLDQLIDRYESLRRYPDAIVCSQRLVECEPFHKDGYLRLMRLFALNGDVPSALKTYQDYARLLQRELGLEPDAEMQDLYAQIKYARKPMHPLAKPESPSPASLPLVGRLAEWQAIQALWKTVLARNPRMLLICGEAGIGKSRLAEELVSWAAHQGIRTAVAHCYSSEGALPYAPVVEWLKASPLPPLDRVWLVELSRLLPELLKDRFHPPSPLTEAWQRLRLFEALARATLGNRQKTLLLIEDLQWCDQDTLEWLHYLLRFDPHTPLLVIGAVRSEEVPANPAYARLLSVLQQEENHLEVELGPLNETETGQLAAHVAGRQLEHGIGSLLYQETEGNPLFIVETVRAELYKRARLPGVQPLPYKARAVLENRIRQLSPATRETALLAAAIGRAFSLEVLRQASGAGEAELIKSLDELLQRRIVREIAQSTFDFCHDKLREAVFAGVSGAHRQLLHRQVAETLVRLAKNDLESKSGEIASHYEQAGNDEAAVQYYRLAADSARKIFANERAIQYTQRALTLCETHLQDSADQNVPLDQIAQLYEKLGDILALVGKYPQAQAAFEQALTQPFSSLGLWRSKIYRKISTVLIAQYQHPQAHAALDQAELALNLPDGAGTLPERQEWIQIQIARSDLFYWENRPDQMDAIIQKIRPTIEAEGRADQQIDLLSQEYQVRMRHERYRPSAETVEIARRKLELAERLGEPYNIAWAQFQLGFALLWHGEPIDGREWLAKGLDTGVQMGARLLEVRSLAYLSIVSRKLGDPKSLREQTQQLLNLAPAIGEHAYHGIGLANQGWLAWRAGDPVSAEQLCTSAIEIWNKSGGDVFHWLAEWVLLVIAVSQHDLGQAERHARALLDPNPFYQPVEEKIADWLGEALCACRAGDAETAFQLFNQTLEMVKASGDL